MFPSDVPDQEYQVRIGAPVVSADGHPIGTVGAVAPDAVTIEQRDPATEHAVVPWGLIMTCDADGCGTVRLTVTQQHSFTNGWDGDQG